MFIGVLMDRCSHFLLLDRALEILSPDILQKAQDNDNVSYAKEF